MHALVRTVFSRLHQLDPLEEEPRAKYVEDELQQAEIRMTVSTSTVPAAAQLPTSLAQSDAEPSAEKLDTDDSVAVAQSDQSAAQGTRSQCQNSSNCIFIALGNDFLTYSWPTVYPRALTRARKCSRSQ
jgi:golgi-specific brefeldin A-resistance guanine nucleotide exchange factor 1